MARLKARASVTDLRAELAARDRQRSADFYERIGLAQPPSCYLLQRAASLEAGEPVEVDGWEISPPLPFDRFTLEPDGTLTLMNNWRT